MKTKMKTASALILAATIFSGVSCARVLQEDAPMVGVDPTRPSSTSSTSGTESTTMTVADEEELIEALEVDDHVTVVSPIEMGELVCDTLEEAEDADALSFVLLNNESVTAEKSSFTVATGDPFTDNIGRKVWTGVVVTPEQDEDEALPRTVSMTWGDICSTETFLLTVTTWNTDETTNILKTVPCFGSTTHTCLVEVTVEFDEPASALVPPGGIPSATTSTSDDTDGGSTGTSSSERRLQDGEMTQIDVMILYSNQSLLLLGGISSEQMETNIMESTTRTNEAFVNSEVALFLNPVHIGPLPYEQTSTTTNDNLTEITDDEDVGNLRDLVGADLVQMVGDFNDGFCGRAWAFVGNSRYGFSVVGAPCLADTTAARQYGHNLGCFPNREDSGFAFPFAHGLRYCDDPDPGDSAKLGTYPTAGWGASDKCYDRYRTIMSKTCGSPGVNYFSNPDVTVLNRPTGTPTEDNARAIGENMGNCHVASLPRSYGIPNDVSHRNPLYGHSYGVSHGIPYCGSHRYYYYGLSYRISHGIPYDGSHRYSHYRLSYVISHSIPYCDSHRLPHYGLSYGITHGISYDGSHRYPHYEPSYGSSHIISYDGSHRYSHIRLSNGISHSIPYCDSHRLYGLPYGITHGISFDGSHRYSHYEPSYGISHIISYSGSHSYFHYGLSNGITHGIPYCVSHRLSHYGLSYGISHGIPCCDSHRLPRDGLSYIVSHTPTTLPATTIPTTASPTESTVGPTTVAPHTPSPTTSFPTASPTVSPTETPMTAPSTTAPSPIAPPTTFTFEACYKDNARHRVLSGDFIRGDETMTTEVCAAFCEGSPYFGTEFGNECFCGVDSGDPDRLGKGRCDFECAGDASQTCGGRNAISVYTFDEPVTPPEFLGCWQDTRGNRIMDVSETDSSMTIELCEGICSAYPFFGTQFGRECWCGGDDTDHTIHGESNSCNVRCAGDNAQRCGGRFAMSVYQHQPVEMPSQSLGCWRDTRGGRIMEFAASSTSMTNEVCARRCSSSYAFYGTQYGRECWCGDAETDHTVHGQSNSCNIECTGDSEELCGGNFAMSVWRYN